MDVVVLGAAGVMGSAVVERLARADATTRVVAPDLNAKHIRSGRPARDALEHHEIDRWTLHSGATAARTHVSQWKEGGFRSSKPSASATTTCSPRKEPSSASSSS